MRTHVIILRWLQNFRFPVESAPALYTFRVLTGDGARRWFAAR